MTELPDLWAKARERLPDDVREWLSGLDRGAQQSPIDAQWIDSLIGQAQEKQEELEKNRHSFSFGAGKHKLELRPLFENMIKWIDKFKGIGDVVSSFDPVHAALPWAAFRFVLQHLVAEQEHSDKFVKLLASMPRLLFTGRIFELVYTKKSMHLAESQDENHIGLESLDHLNRELVDLYGGLLSALQFCYSFFSKRKTMRKVAAVFNSSKPAEILVQLEEQHKKVVGCGDNCRNISSRKLEQRYLTLLEGHQTSLGQMNDRVNQILVQIDEKERLRTLLKISDILFRAHHRSVSVKRTPGTCDWLITNTKFARWMEGSSTLIVLYGIPGAGKTFLTSRVVDFVVENTKRNEAVAFFYCKRDEENRRNPQDIFRSILRQISSDFVSDERKIHPVLKSLPERLESKGLTFDLSTCKSLIGEITKDYSKTTIILDALDECDRDNRWEIMATFDELVQVHQNLRIFLSSRTDDDIQRHFQSQPLIEIQATDNEEDICTFVRDELSPDPRWGQLSPGVQQEIQHVFRVKSQGMFQWASLQIRQIRRLIPWNTSTIADHLERAPNGLREAYDVVWSQIEDMPHGRNLLAHRALLWVLCAFEPLHTTELSTAMQIDSDSTEAHPYNYLGKEDILGICGNLLVHDQYTEVWRFCHLSAREYVENVGQYDSISAHSHVAISSFNFLKQNLVYEEQEKVSFSRPQVYRLVGRKWHDPASRNCCHVHHRLHHRFSSFQYHEGWRDSEYRKRWKWNPPESLGWNLPAGEKRRYLRDYILRETLNHARQASSSGARNDSLKYHLKGFLGSMFTGSPAFVVWRDLYIIRGLASWACFHPESSPLEIATIFGLYNLLEDWWEVAVHDLDKLGTGIPSPLPLAIEYNHESIWRFLIQKSSGTNTGCPLPLMVAIEVGSMSAFKALIEAGEDVNGIDPDPERAKSLPFGDERARLSRSDRSRLRVNTPFKTALVSSRHNGCIDLENSFVHELLNNGARIDLSTECGDAIEFAALNLSGHYLRFLLDKVPIVSDPDYVLFLAAGNWQINLFNDNLLRRIGASNVHRRLRRNQMTALTHAVQKCQSQAVHLLLRLGARIDLACGRDREAVVRAAKSHRGGDILAQLVKYGMNINANDGETNLLSMGLLSLSRGFYGGLSVLIKAGADVNQILPRSPLPTPLTIAAANGVLEPFSTLLDAGADPTLVIDAGVGSALASAAFFGQLDICRALLRRTDLDVNATQKGFFRNPLHAVIRGHSYFGVYRTSPFDLVKFRRFHPVRPRHLKVIQLFFEKGLDVCAPSYSSPNTWCSLSYVNLAGYEAKESCLFYARRHHSSFPGAWSYIMWELISGPRPQVPIQACLRRWGFPGNLPPNINLVAKLAPVYKDLPLRFVVWDTCGNLSVLRAIPARQHSRYGLNMRTGRRGWVRYVPQNDSTFKGVQNYAELAGGYAVEIKRFRSCDIFGALVAFIVLLFVWLFTQASLWLGAGFCYIGKHCQGHAF